MLTRRCLKYKLFIAIRISSILKPWYVNRASAQLLPGKFTCNSFQSADTRLHRSAAWFGTMAGNKDMFRLSDYDCVGFDLDNTLLRYKIEALMTLEYEVMARFLVGQRGYDAEYLLRPLTQDADFLQKGLVLDFERGNVLQLAHDGSVRKASHGTRPMTESELLACYGHDKRWEVASLFHRDPLGTWNGPLAQRMRSLLDYFDAPASVAFGRIVDSLDAQAGRVVGRYDVWPDVLDGLGHMFGREQFAADGGDYFPALKKNPDKYIRKCDPQIVHWLRTIKKSKVVFLVTGSNADFATFTAQNCLGNDWRDLFDVVVCYARKPGFFIGSRPFLRLDGFCETQEVTANQLVCGSMYSQGNWHDLRQLFIAETGKEQPKCVYFGDNLIQDIYTPTKFELCDTVAMVEELLVETSSGSRHPDAMVLSAGKWGPYLRGASPTIWTEIVHKYARVCVSDLGVMASRPLDSPLSCIDPHDLSSSSGYYISDCLVDS